MVKKEKAARLKPITRYLTGKQMAKILAGSHFPDHALWISDRVVMLKEGRVVADGNTGDVISRTNLYRLYNTPVDVLNLDGGYRICVPEALRRFRGATAASNGAIVGLARVAG